MNIGDVLRMVDYVRVTGLSNGVMHVKNVHTGLEFKVEGQKLIDAADSADEYTDTVKASRTEVVTKLTESQGMPFTACFTKVNGSERVIRGRFLAKEQLMGRSYVEDLDIQESHKQRQVDHRSIKWLVLDGVKYLVK